jgi:2,3-bisphosphoglycerate-dependent phosphoglycerate mutase
VIDRLLLVRHGQTIHNVAGIAQGWNDSELSDEGRSQVKRLAERLAHSDATGIYSSSLGRALSTAEVIADATGLPIVPLDDLREMNYGRWEGRSFLDIHRDDEEIYRRWIDDEGCRSPGGGESHADVRIRMERAFARISAESSRPIVISHGTAIRIGATVLLSLPVMASQRFAQHNAALNEFRWRTDRWVLMSWNDTSHCDGLEIP